MSIASNVHAFDKRLLARMIGALGEDKIIGRIALELGQVFSELLPDMLEAETGCDITIGYAGFRTGLRNEVIADLGDGAVLGDVSLRNWCTDFQIGCDSPVLIALGRSRARSRADEHRGAAAAASLENRDRCRRAGCSTKVAEVLRTAVDAPGGFEPVVGRPYNSPERPKPDPPRSRMSMAAAIDMDHWPWASAFHFLRDRSAKRGFSKTEIASVRGAGENQNAKSEWAEQLEEQVRRSAVTLEARIRLESLTLNTISRLQPGDVIPFHDGSEVRVDVNANGRDLYVCEFGRSGSKYTVRVRDTHGSRTGHPSPHHELISLVGRMPEARFNWKYSRTWHQRKQHPPAEPAAFTADVELDQAIDRPARRSQEGRRNERLRRRLRRRAARFAGGFRQRLWG